MALEGTGFGSFGSAAPVAWKSRLSVRVASFVAIVVAPVTLIAFASHVLH